LERGERIVAFIGQEGGGEPDFCAEILEICERSSIPARCSRKLGEEVVRWLEDRIRPDLALAVGASAEIPLAIGGNCRLGLLEIIDCLQSDSCPGIVLRQRGQWVSTRVLPPPAEAEEAEGFYLKLLKLVDEMLNALETYLDELAPPERGALISVPFAVGSEPFELGPIVDRSEPGPETGALESQLAEYLCAARTFALRSNLEAFELLCRSLELAENDEVICPGIVSTSALEAIQGTGARPILVDVEPGRLTLDPAQVEAAISSRTRALVIAHPFGQPARLDQLYEIAEHTGLEVIEDGAASLGARFGDSRLGRSPCATIFRMPLGACDASMHAALVTLPPALAERFAEEVDNHRLGDGAAAVARQVLETLDDRIAMRRRNANAYSAGLSRYDAFEVPPTPEEALPVYSSYVLRVTRYARTTADDLQKLLGENGVESRRLRLPLRDRDMARLPVADAAVSSSVLLPVEDNISEAQQEHVLDALFSYAIG
jgi:dTDP-3-amino-3,4,6-trideoxy-alpha-D-glucose transaminase